MSRVAKEMTTQGMKDATFWASERVRGWLERAEAVKDDRQAKERREQGLCRACFYAPPTIAGQAFTSRPCMSCHQEQTYSTTATDVLCQTCAHEHSLCRHCGGDLEMRLGRRKWPVPQPRESEQSQGLRDQEGL